MNKNHNFKLIDGQFDPSDARSVLFTLLNSKINFHSMEAFAIKERTSGDTSFHEKRIKQLTKSNVNIKKVIDYAEKNNLSLLIDSTIEIKLIDDSKGK